MNHPSKRRALWAISLLTVSLVAGCDRTPSPTASSAAKNPIKLGILYDGSGGASFFSAHVVRGIELAVAKVNASGGILGRPVELIREDDGNDANASSLRTRSLIEKGAVATFLTSGSASTLQARGVLSEAKVPGLVATNLSDKVTQPPNETFVFNFANTTSGIVKFLTDNLKQYKRLALFADHSATGTALANSYKAAFEKGDIPVIAVEFVDVGATDATAQVARTKAANPDAIFITGQAAPEQALFLRTLHANGLKVPIFQDTNAQLPQYWELAGADALSTMRFIDQLDPEHALTNEVRQAYAAKYGKEPFLAFHAQGWDLVYMLKQAMETAKSTDGTQVRDSLERLSGYEAHWGKKGYKISCSKENHLCSNADGMVLRTFKDGVPGPLASQ